MAKRRGWILIKISAKKGRLSPIPRSFFFASDKTPRAELPYVSLGQNLLLAPPESAGKIAKQLSQEGFVVRTQVGAAKTERQYLTANSNVLGRWKSYFCTLDILLESAQDTKNNENMEEFLSAALKSAKAIVMDLQTEKVLAVPEDADQLSHASDLQKLAEHARKAPPEAREEIGKLRQFIAREKDVLKVYEDKLMDLL